jgi:hypothetical protein
MGCSKRDDELDRAYHVQPVVRRLGQRDRDLSRQAGGQRTRPQATAPHGSRVMRRAAAVRRAVHIVGHRYGADHHRRMPHGERGDHHDRRGRMQEPRSAGHQPTGRPPERASRWRATTPCDVVATTSQPALRLATPFGPVSCGGAAHTTQGPGFVPPPAAPASVCSSRRSHDSAPCSSARRARGPAGSVGVRPARRERQGDGCGLRPYVDAQGNGARVKPRGRRARRVVVQA